jgi:hypothetical protein
MWGQDKIVKFAESQYATTSDRVSSPIQVFGGPSELAFVQEHELKATPDRARL